ncbi:aldolase/citrate lyase family protein [Paenibacillus chitinolyticus]|uniref:aldolase/citrate lyase family protein n=1 Tax=Paenibacillus chitinolyticus TaxID=79263 RepID=UPI0036D8B132
MIKNSFQHEDITINGVLVQSSSKDVLNAVCYADLECVILDMQHGFWSLNELESFMTRCGINSANKIAPFVRTPINPSISTIGSIMDAGAWGLVIPFVETAEELEEIRKWSMYPPTGVRSLARCSGLVNTGLNIEDYISWTKHNTIIIAIVETPKGLDNLKQIIEQSDGVLFGIRDLCLITGNTQIRMIEEIEVILDDITEPNEVRFGFLGVTLNYLKRNRPTFNIIGSIRDLLINSINTTVKLTQRNDHK